MNVTHHIRIPQGQEGKAKGRVFFYPVGIGDKNTEKDVSLKFGKWKLRTFLTLIRSLHDDKVNSFCIVLQYHSFIPGAVQIAVGIRFCTLGCPDYTE